MGLVLIVRIVPIVLLVLIVVIVQIVLIVHIVLIVQFQANCMLSGATQGEVKPAKMLPGRRFASSQEQHMGYRSSL